MQPNPCQILREKNTILIKINLKTKKLFRTLADNWLVNIYKITRDPVHKNSALGWDPSALAVPSCRCGTLWRCLVGVVLSY